MLPFPGFRSYCRGYPYAGPHAVPADYWGIRTVVQARTTSTGRDLPPVILTTGKREWTLGPFSFQRLTVDEDCVSLFGSSHSLFSRAAIFFAAILIPSSEPRSWFLPWLLLPSCFPWLRQPLVLANSKWIVLPLLATSKGKTKRITSRKRTEAGGEQKKARFDCFTLEFRLCRLTLISINHDFNNNKRRNQPVTPLGSPKQTANTYIDVWLRSTV